MYIYNICIHEMHTNAYKHVSINIFRLCNVLLYWYCTVLYCDVFIYVSMYYVYIMFLYIIYMCIYVYIYVYIDMQSIFMYCYAYHVGHVFISVNYIYVM